MICPSLSGLDLLEKKCKKFFLSLSLLLSSSLPACPFSSLSSLPLLLVKVIFLLLKTIKYPLSGMLLIEDQGNVFLKDKLQCT